MILGQAKKFSAKTASVPAPIGGWNGRDSLAQMAPTDAVQMVNWYPTPTDVTMRKGYTVVSTGITGAVHSLMNYNKATSGYNLFAAAGTVIYDAKPSPATSVFTGITNDKFQHVNITNTAGHFLVACNGVDPTLIYDGTAWFKVATTTTAATISTITHVGAVATLTTATAHNLITGNRVTISGASSSEYNGTFVITKTGANTFTYTMASAPALNATVVGTYTVIGITGVDSSTFINVNLFKNRLYFTQKDTLTCWYLDVNSIGGTIGALTGNKPKEPKVEKDADDTPKTEKVTGSISPDEPTAEMKSAADATLPTEAPEEFVRGVVDTLKELTDMSEAEIVDVAKAAWAELATDATKCADPKAKKVEKDGFDDALSVASPAEQAAYARQNPTAPSSEKK